MKENFTHQYFPEASASGLAGGCSGLRGAWSGVGGDPKGGRNQGDRGGAVLNPPRATTRPEAVLKFLHFPNLQIIPLLCFQWRRTYKTYGKDVEMNLITLDNLPSKKTNKAFAFVVQAKGNNMY
jgi:hypothetical protein